MTAKKALVSYSHADETHRKSLHTALSNMVRRGLLKIWSDHQILPGQHIDDHIAAQLKEADIVFLLVSPDFIESEYCYKKELQIALERHENGRSVVVPVVVRPTELHGAPFSRLLMLPADARPVTTWPNADEAWLSVASGVRKLLESSPADQPSAQAIETKRMKVHLADAFDQLQKRYSDPDAYRSPRFGFGLEKFDDFVDGVWPGEFMAIASRPDHGHVELAHALVIDAALKRGLKVLVLSQRLTANQFTNRLLCSLGRISRFRFIRGELDDEDWSRVASSIRMLKDSDITIDDERVRSSAELDAKFAKSEPGGFDLVLLDGIEYFSDGADERAIALSISDFSRRSKAAVVGTISLGAEMEARGYQKPMLHDLGSWRLVENFASKIVFCHRGFVEHSATPDELSEKCTLSLVKSPSGVTISVEAKYFHEYGVINGLIMPGSEEDL